MSAKWLAIYTRPRWEKKVHQLLLQKGVESYCPLNKVHRKWSDRIKLIEEPLFKSYVFVRIEEDRRTEVRMTEGVINFVYGDGKPAVIKDKEIQAIQRFLSEYEDVEVVKVNWKPNERVMITGGALINTEGRVVQVGSKTVKVMIESLDYLLLAKIDKSKLIPLGEDKTK
ncbi:UpxY family transcription antiterminator [Flaviaesturariibacter amylovorans]|uniref:UpxY family transcription antiterminator n=1 Tax=Flaviaesturariibacter amylovorans TaxID=1084520 RepID=UPI0031EAA354